MNQTLKIGLVSISDRASQGVYEDKGLPALRDWLKRTVTTPLEFEARLIADEQDEIQSTLIDLVDYQGCQLVLTTGGTGPAPRDVTPGSHPGGGRPGDARFGEQMRQISLAFVPTAIFVAPGGGDPQTGADSEPARPAQGDCRNAGRPARRRRPGESARHFCRRALLPGFDRRAVDRHRPGGGESLPPEIRPAPGLRPR